jgi:hypothetical protein
MTKALCSITKKQKPGEGAVVGWDISCSLLDFLHLIIIWSSREFEVEV